jgi:hypothetical protein
MDQYLQTNHSVRASVDAFDLQQSTIVNGAKRVPSLKPVDLSKKLRPFMGKWVAMSQDQKRVIASASTFERVLAASKKKRPQDIPIVLKVSDKYPAILMV